MIWFVTGILAGAVAGTLIYIFREELKEWASEAIKRILDEINKAIYIASQGIVYLVKQGRRYFKEVRTYLKQRQANKYEVLKTRESIALEDIPEDIINEMGYEEEKEMLRLRNAN